MVRGVRGYGGRSARWVLLACTLFGLATMHTLGHAGLHMHAHAGPHMPAHGRHAAPAAVVLSGPMPGFDALYAPTRMADAVCVGGCADTPASSPHGVPASSPHGVPASSPHGGPSSWSVCLAVLVALAALVLLSMLVARSRRGRPAAPEPGSWAVASRDPPVGRAGLAVVAVSVLRI